MSSPVCYTRYNNRGGKYVVCNSQKKGEGKPPPAPKPPLISVEDFLKGMGKGYSKLTAGQKRAYHRIDMANRRREESEVISKGEEALQKMREEKKAEREKWKTTRGTIMDGLKKKNKSLAQRLREKNEAFIQMEKDYKRERDLRIQNQQGVGQVAQGVFNVAFD
jgi:hypothetical protein